MRTLTLILGIVRLDNQIRNLEPNLWYMLPGGLPDPSFETIAWFLCCGSESQVGAEVDVGSKCVHNGQVSAVYSNGAEKSETHIDTLEPASTGAPFLEKRVFRTQITWWMIPSQSPYLMKAWMAQTRWRQLRLYPRGWTEEILNLHPKGNVKLN